MRGPDRHPRPQTQAPSPTQPSHQIRQPPIAPASSAGHRIHLSQLVIQIPPPRIMRLNQLKLPLPLPALHKTLTTLRIVETVVELVPDQPAHKILGRKARPATLPMLRHPSNKVRRMAHIQSPIPLARKDVHRRLSLGPRHGKSIRRPQPERLLQLSPPSRPSTDHQPPRPATVLAPASSAGDRISAPHPLPLLTPLPTPRTSLRRPAPSSSDAPHLMRGPDLHPRPQPERLPQRSHPSRPSTDHQPPRPAAVLAPASSAEDRISAPHPPPPDAPHLRLPMPRTLPSRGPPPSPSDAPHAPPTPRSPLPMPRT